MNRSLPVAILLCALTVGAWLLWPRAEITAPPTNAPAPSVAADGPGPAAAAAIAQPAAPAAAPADASVAPERTAAPAADAAGPVCVLRGRCVDAAGQPIAGVQVTLTGWGANDQRVQAWLSDHDEPKRIDEKLTTGPDGVFSFRFWPPPPFQFALRLHTSGFATWGSRWSELAAGITKDLGDVKLERGTLLRGRVIDANGTPLAKAEVRIDKAAGRRAGNGFEHWTSARTDDDGAFAARWALLPGEYKLGIDDQQIERGELVTLSGEPEQTVEVVLKRLDDREAIAGVVVDQDGAPVRGAYVHPSVSGSGRLITTDREGKFRVPRPAKDAPDRVHLSVSCTGYEATPDQQEYEWGRTDVRLVLRKGLALEVLVVRASDDTPIEDYTLRVVPISGFSFSSDDQRPRGKSPHEGGRQSVSGIRVGDHQILVEPKGDEFAVGVATATMTATGAPQVVVRLAANTPRQVRVRFADDRPVAGARVQLVDPLGLPLTTQTPIYQLSEWGNTTAKKALVLDAGTTDEGGVVTMHVPADRTLGLSLPGPAHAPMVVPVAVFPAEGPLVVTVDQGAVLIASVGPAAAMAEIRTLAGAGPTEELENWHLPSLFLQRGDLNPPVRFPDLRERCSLQPDGTFTLRGIPPGKWHVTVQCFRKHDHGGNYLEVPAGSFDLAAGQETKIAVDLTALSSCELAGLVLHNGAPLANTKVTVNGSLGIDAFGNQQNSYEQITTDGDGRFRVMVRGNSQSLVWAKQDGQRWTTLRSAEDVAMTPGQTAQATFTLSSGALKVRLVDAAGEPVAKVSVLLRGAMKHSMLSLPPTDAAGRTSTEGEVGTFDARVLPKSLQDQQALTAFYQAHAGEPDPTAAVMVSLGVVTLRTGETTEVELRLPANW
jgi:protocatechuate 3,4-dioxygenase beta subunit